MKMPKKKILIFDDNDILVEMMTLVMVSEGYEANGMALTADFMDIVEDYKPDIILIDYNKVSRFNAYELCFRIKINPQTDHIPVILLSVYQCQVLDRMSGDSPDAFVSKPFSFEELTRKVERLLSGVPTRTDNWPNG